MAATGPIIGFVPVTDGDRARLFYANVLGLRLVQDDGFAVVFQSEPVHGVGGNMIRLVRMPQVTPAPFTILGWEASDITADVRGLAAMGVKFLRYPLLQQDESGIWAAPNGDKVAWFKDPDSNVLSLSQHQTTQDAD